MAPSPLSLQKTLVLTENLGKPEGFEQLFSITGGAGKADPLVENFGQIFTKIQYLLERRSWRR